MRSDMNKLVSLVVPFYNEEAGVVDFFQRLQTVFAGLPKYRFEVIAINDGSRDQTLQMLLNSQKTNSNIYVVDLSRNFGKEAALTAGLDRAVGDATIAIDADLQHPPELINTLLEKWEHGFEVVLAKRNSRVTDSPLQKRSANLFYKLHNWISDIEIPEDVGDFRLMDKVVVESLRQLRENRRFMKGLFAWVGYRTTTVPYDVAPRISGHSSFNFWKLWNFALEGITSFSSVPLRVWTYLGFLVSVLSLLYALFIVIHTLFSGVDTPGYASIMVAILFFGGVQLIGIGVLGEYIGRIYSEVKRRPVYVVRKEYASHSRSD